MKVLLDTHAFLWFINDDSQLSLPAKKLMESNIDLLLSIASLWEISIKVSLRKLSLPSLFDLFIPEQLQVNEIEILPIELRHLTPLIDLPFHHRDPFDRLILAQAMAEKAIVISRDEIFDRYDVDRFW
jgi:PIN domain nuclease of toxin-antitoxin system